MLIVGAGLSGIGAACWLQRRCPGKRYAILEARAASGGTWDLFRYPGVRSDSDMPSLGYSFRPWRSDAAIAGGDAILDYLRRTASEQGVDRHVQFGRRVISAHWHTGTATWTVHALDAQGAAHEYTCRFLYLCCGYYDYAQPHAPSFDGEASFRGTRVHPQHWPAELDCTGRRVVVIGSGATAVTLVPALAKTAAHVTMLQRSPTWIAALPSRDPVARALLAALPARWAHALVRGKNIALQAAFHAFSRRWPKAAARLLLRGVARQLGGAVDLRHFTPTYAPWDQRLCLVPDADLFVALRDGRAEVVTDHVARFEADGLRLASGRFLPADVVVSATGLQLRMLGGIALQVDGTPVALPERTVYKGMMLDGVPNLAIAVGYTNAAWTLKSELVAQYVCRLLAHLDRHRLRQCTPRLSGPVRARPLIDFTSGYVQRAAAELPRQGDRAPWRLYQNWFLDRLALRHGALDDEMEFGNPE